MTESIDSWSKAIRRNWDKVIETEDRLSFPKKRAKKIKIEAEKPKPGAAPAIRYLIIIIDVSEKFFAKDSRFQRIKVVQKSLSSFVDRFLDDFSLRFLSIALAGNRAVTKLADFGDKKERIIKKVHSFISQGPENLGGEFSLQSCLEFAKNAFRNSAKGSAKDILLILSASNTTDERNGALAEIFSEGIRVSAVHFNVGACYFHRVCRLTNGLFERIGKTENDFSSAILRHLGESPKIGLTQSFFRAGFPPKDGSPLMCHCHSKRNKKVYRCARCQTCFCKIPFYCDVCQTLNSSLSAVILSAQKGYSVTNDNFSETENGTACFGCGFSGPRKNGEESQHFVCNGCLKHFFAKCKEFCVDHLNECVGCFE